MIDEKTTTFLDSIEKTAADSSTGMSQKKHKVQKSIRNYAGEGAGLGGLIGSGAGALGALSKKYRGISAAAGGIIGALAGRELGNRTKGVKMTHTDEGTVKRQDKKLENASVPRLTDQKVLKLLKASK